MKIQDEEERIHLLQDNLRTIRLLCRWTLDDLASRLGVTKQTISRFENKKVNLNRAMYIAVRTVLEEKCSEEKSSGDNNSILIRAIPLLLKEGEGEKLTDTEYTDIKKTLETIAAASSGNADRGVLSNILSNAINMIPSLVTAGAAVVSAVPSIILAATGAAVIAAGGAATLAAGAGTASEGATDTSAASLAEKGAFDASAVVPAVIAAAPIAGAFPFMWLSKLLHEGKNKPKAKTETN